MSQVTTCRHAMVWIFGDIPHCVPCRDLRLSFVRAALTGLCANSAIDTGAGWREIADQAVHAADQALRQAGEVR